MTDTTTRSLNSRRPVIEDSTVTPCPTLLSLPMVPFERLMFNSDSSETPMVFRVHMRYEGDFQKAQLDEAFRVAIARQPLLNSLVTNTPGGPAWCHTPHGPELKWESTEVSPKEIPRLPIDGIDLTVSTGLRARAWKASGGLSIILDFHHACCDGQGARQFIGEWWGLYNQLINNQPIKLARIDPELLHERGNYRVPNPPIGFLEGLRNLYLTVSGRTIYVPKRKDLKDSEKVEDSLFEVVFTKEETSALRAGLKRKHVTVNDAGLAASLVAFSKSFPELMRPRHLISVLLPVDLRWPSDLKMPACNRVGVCFPRRYPGDLANRQELLTSLQKQMKYIKQRYVGAEFLRGLAFSQGKQGPTDLLQKFGFFVPTYQFTCLGDTTRAMQYPYPMDNGVVNFQGLRLQHIAGIMQIGPFLPLSLAACETSSNLALTLRANSRYVTSQKAEQFLNLFAEEMLAIGE